MSKYPIFLSFKPSNTTGRSYYVNLCKKNPLGYTNFKEISRIRAHHFSSRQHENEAENKMGLKHMKFSKISIEKYDYETGICEKCPDYRFPKGKKDVMF